MSGIDKITARIRSDAEAETKQALEQAGREAAEVIRKHQEEAERQAEEIIRRGKAQADERLTRLAGVAELEAGKNTLTAKQEMLSEAFTRAASVVADLPEEKYIAFLSKLAAGSAGDGYEKIVLSRADRDKYGDRILASANVLLSSEGKQAGLTLSEETANISGGLILKGDNMEVNCALETIITFVRGEVSSEVADILFNGDRNEGS